MNIIPGIVVKQVAAAVIFLRPPVGAAEDLALLEAHQMGDVLSHLRIASSFL
jgi:hypothetical protein